MTKARDLGDFISDGTIAETVTADGLNLGDNEKIQLGASQDLQLFHDGSHSIVKDSGTGNLKLLAENFSVQDPNQTEQMILATPNGSVNLYYNGSKMFETTATGATVTGTIAVSDSFNATSGTFTVQSNGTDILNVTSTLMSPQTDGAISLGSASNGFNNLHLDGSVYAELIRNKDDTDTYIQWPGNNTLAFNTGGSERFRIGSSGQIGIGGATYGTAGQVLTSGGSGATPTWADAGGAADEVELAITETIAAGDAMQLNSDGSIDKVLEQIVGTTQNVSLSVSNYSSGALSNAGKKVLKFVPDDPSRFVAIYRDDGNSGYPTAVAGSISGTTITLGTPTIIRSSNTTYDGIDFDFDPNDTTSLTVIYYNGGGDTNDITEITLNGTTITASGSYTSFSDYSRNEGCCIKFVPGSANPGYFVISGKYSFISGVGSDRRSTRVGVLSNGSYTLGAEYEFDTTTDNALNDNIAFLPSDSSKFVLAYQDTSNDYVKLAVLTINFSGKTLAAGSPLIAEDDSGNTYPGRSGSVICAIDPTSNHVLLSVVNVDFDLLCAGFSISGTTLTQVANATDIDTARNSSRMGLGIDKSYGSGKMVLCYSHSSPTDTIRTSIVKYTSSTGAFAIQNSVNSTYTYDNNYHTADVSQDGSGIFLSFYKSGSEGHLNLGRLGVDVNTSNLDTTKLHGIAQEAGVSGNSISVAFGGIDETQTGMTPGSTLYIQGDGSLGTTSTDAKKIGRAITATKLIIDSSQ